MGGQERFLPRSEGIIRPALQKMNSYPQYPNPPYLNTLARSKQFPLDTTAGLEYTEYAPHTEYALC